MKRKIEEAFDRFDNDHRVQGTESDEARTQVLAAFQEAVAPLLSSRAIAKRRRRRSFEVDLETGALWNDIWQALGISDERKAEVFGIVQGYTAHKTTGVQLILKMSEHKLTDMEWTACMYLIGWESSKWR